ncbi:DUF3341 domain-containing protein [Aureimonas sp. AU20]|uniref:DUF3341 domain-containing protein n=1 Tax=Aureimonas sp. AU20 TaxID=1349819 RepID=UPI00071F2701|nr:DUF3341 domain-containing protein [Aureimonas sp. AU20]ALN72613.1 hypothetical protein M673_07810 [Aureimonas sp. AU20]
MSAPRLLGEFDGPRQLLHAARLTRQTSPHRVTDAYSPLPVEGLLAEIEDIRPSRLPLALLFGGLGGAALGVALQWVSATQILPVLAGGRPFASWPDFGFAIFELAILGAAVSGFVALLVGCGLPRLHHPLFGVPDFTRATQDRFFLEIEPADEAEGRAHLGALGAIAVHEVPPV